MSLRTKLMWAGVLIVLIPMLLSTVMMWYLIRSQDDREAQQRSGRFLDMIRKELERQGQELVGEMQIFIQDPALLTNLSNLNLKEQITLTPLMQESNKRGTALLLEKFARINAYDRAWVFDQDRTVVAYVRFDDETRTLGFTMIDSDEHLEVKAVTVDLERRFIPRDAWEPQENNPQFPPVPTTTQDASQGYGLSIFEGHIALTISIPVVDVQQAESEFPVLGNILAYKFINADFAQRLAFQTQADVNFFVHSKLYSGSLAEFTDLSETVSNALEQIPDDTERPYSYTETRISDIPYYQAFYPLIRDKDGKRLSTVAVSLSKESAYRRTRQVTLLQAGVSLACLVIIIPITLLMTGRFAEPIRKIAGMSEAIAKGHIKQRIEPIRSQDEIGVLSRSFSSMVEYLRNMAKIADALSHGEIVQELEPKTEDDVLGIAFYRMISYFKKIVHVADRLHQGDLTQRVELQSEQDVLGEAFNNVIGQLQSLVTFVRTESRQLAEVSGNVANASEDSSRNSQTQTKSVETITSALQEMAVNIQKISGNLDPQATAIAHVKNSAQHITTSSEDVANEVKQVSDFTEQTASAIESMDVSVQDMHQQVQVSVEASGEVVRVAKEGSEQVARLTNEIHSIHGQMELASSAILRLQKESEHIRGILEVIQDVMEQTNLLALNASIIAAQAGEHGKAFGVVADEVKGLASRTSESTKEIAEFTKTIHAELSDAVTAIMVSAKYVEEGLQIADKTGQFLEIITTGAEQSSMLIGRIADNVESHTKASRQVHQASGQVVNMLEHIAQLTQEQHEQSASIHHETEHLIDISLEIQHAIKEQEISANQSVKTMESMISIVQQNAKRAERLATLATELSSQANMLLDLVEEFTLDER